MRTFTIIDAYGLLFRAYYALPNLTTSYGLAIGGVYGFINIFLKYIEKHTTDYLVVVFDTGSKNFRHDIYPEYKNNRPKLPSNLISQFSLLREAVNALNIASEEVKGYEADDIIATLSKKYSQFLDIKFTIVTSDKDLLQLLSDNICIFDPIKNKYILEKDVQDKFGISSSKLLDFLSLTGDASDNIPGVPGIGVKTAAKLLNDFGSLDALLMRAHEIEKNKLRESIIKYSDQAILSRQLVTLCNTVDIGWNIEKYVCKNSKVQELSQFLEKYELQSLVNKVNKVLKINTSFVSANVDQNSNIDYKSAVDNEVISYCEEKLKVFIEKCKYEGVMALHIEITDNVIGNMSLSYSEDALFYIDQDYIGHALEIIKPVLNLNYVLKIIYDVKALLKIIPDINIVAFDDIMLMSYSLNAGLHDHSLKSIIDYNVSHGVVNANISAVTLFLLYQVLKKNLVVNQLYTVYERFEKPLIYVLDNMEKVGVLVDIGILRTLSSTFSKEINILKNEIYKISGTEFNIASSKQLRKILFDRMSIEKGKKLSSGVYSIDAEVLSKLAANGVEIASKVLKWRHFTKLKSAYTDVLEKQIDSKSGRIHTFYSMVSTVTGRLSSSNPNLQSIPVKSKQGNAIRRAFIAKKGYKLIAADYSQMELRIIAHIANVQAFKDAFFLDQDIHLITARQIFGTENLNESLRRKAKAINFGIIYGMSAFGLSKQLGISRSEASAYIDSYFKSYPEIQSYIEEINFYAKTYSYTRTIFGRKCFIKGINSTNIAARNFSKRAAINAPLQGTSADIIKMSMINLFSKLEKGSLILQVHDELLFEVLEERVDDTVKIIKKEMENVVKLSVPLKVDIKVGDNWADLAYL